MDVLKKFNHDALEPEMLGGHVPPCFVPCHGWVEKLDVAS